MGNRRFSQWFFLLLSNAFIFRWFTVPLFRWFPCPFMNCHGCPFSFFACPIGVMEHAFSIGTISFLTIGIIFLFGGIFGRMLCGWLCPAGFLQELVNKIPIKKRKIPNFLFYLKYPILFFFVFFLPFFFTHQPDFCRFICPVGTFEAGILGIWYDQALRRMVDWIFYLKVGILAMVIIALFFYRRFFCHVLCPLGTIFSFFNKVSLVQIEVKKENCPDNCNACEKKCPMSLKVQEEINSSSCIRCMECTFCKNISFYPSPSPIKSKIENAEIIVVFAFLILLDLLIFLWKPLNSTIISIPQLNEIGIIENPYPAPYFKLKNIEGKEFNLEKEIGKNYIFLDFWATWCYSCNQALPHIEKIHKDYKDKGLVVIVISEDGPESVGKVASFMKEKGYTMEVLLDTDGKVSKMYKVDAIPYKVLIDQNGNIVWQHKGYVKGDENEYREMIEKFLEKE